jgi:hypothetical protein
MLVKAIVFGEKARDVRDAAGDSDSLSSGSR